MNKSFRKKIFALALSTGITGSLVPASASSSVSYTYDELGRLSSAAYNNGLCIAYTYDANGNRTAVTNPAIQSPPVWGSATWGCFYWPTP